MTTLSARATTPSKRATTVTLSETTVADARELGINISRAAEDGVARAIAAKLTELWLIENTHALDSANEYVRKHDLPLEKFRQF